MMISQKLKILKGCENKSFTYNKKNFTLVKLLFGHHIAIQEDLALRGCYGKEDCRDKRIRDVRVKF